MRIGNIRDMLNAFEKTEAELIGRIEQKDINQIKTEISIKLRHLRNLVMDVICKEEEENAKLELAKKSEK